MYFKPPSDRQLHLATERRTVIPELQADSPWGATGFTRKRPADGIGPTGADSRIGAGNTGPRAEPLVCDEVVNFSTLQSRIDRCRVVEDFENNLMNLLEPEGRFWNLVPPSHGNDLNTRLKKNPAFAQFPRAVESDFEPVWEGKWRRNKLMARTKRGRIGAFRARFIRDLPRIRHTLDHLLPLTTSLSTTAQP